MGHGQVCNKNLRKVLSLDQSATFIMSLTDNPALAAVEDAAPLVD